MKTIEIKKPDGSTINVTGANENDTKVKVVDEISKLVKQMKKDMKTMKKATVRGKNMRVRVSKKRLRVKNIKNSKRLNRMMHLDDDGDGVSEDAVNLDLGRSCGETTKVSEERLAEVSKILKTEFIGIDNIIDHVIQSITNWFSSDKQNTPTIICLWGMTGTGKTRLIDRLFELLGIENTIKLNMVKQSENEQYLLDLHHMNNKKQIFIMDEFQHARTLDPHGEHILRDDDYKGHKWLWEFLDTGIMETKESLISWYQMVDIYDSIENIKKMPLVKQKITRRMPYKEFKKKHACPLSFQIFVAISKKYKNISIKQFFDMAIGEIYDEYLSCEKSITKTVKYDYTKSLVFIIGNLDELYTSSSNMDSDIDPDLLYERCKKITFQNVKNVLMRLFRPEQISRLGNNHVCYSAFSKQHYRDLITMYLKKLNKQYEVDYVYGESLMRLIYDEGVFPTQGVRPIISTIKYVLECNLETINKTYGKTGTVDYKNNKLVVNGDRKNSIKIILVNKRKKVDYSSKDYQTTCVHECGHALAHYLLFKQAPPNIVVKTNTYEYEGFVEFEGKSFESPDDLINDITVRLAGLTAEHIVYGHHTTGSSNDLKNATLTAQAYFTNIAMGNKLTVTKETYQEDSLPTHSSLEEVEKLLQTCRANAGKLLNENIDMLKKLTKLLYKRSKVSSSDFNRLFKIKANKEKNSEIFKAFIG